MSRLDAVRLWGAGMDQRTITRFSSDGWCLLHAAIDEPVLQRLRCLTQQLVETNGPGVRASAGAVYAARNVLDLVPEIRQAWKTPALIDFVSTCLGPDAGLVRALFFDKPPGHSWGLPWHKDLLIAVQPFAEAEGYSQPRLRVGVTHTEPPLEVLKSMLTLRIHLDEITEENGPLQVATSSHITGKALKLTGCPIETIFTNAGDVLAMTPLLSHCSGRSHAATTRHRRVLHLEFSNLPRLPGGVRWHCFGPVTNDEQ